MVFLAIEQVVAAAHGLGEVEALDAAGGAFPAVAVAGEDEGGPVKFAHDTGGDDADDAEMPLHVALDDDEIVLGVEAFADALDGLVGCVALDFSAFVVVVVEGLGSFLGLVVVPGQQEVQRRIWVVHSAGGVEARAKVKTDIEDGDRRGDVGHFLEGEEAGPGGLAELLEAGADEFAVLAGQRHEVGHGAKGDEVEVLLEVEVAFLLEPLLAAALDERVGELEGEAHGAEFLEVRVVVAELWVDHGQWLGWRVADLMMVQHEDVDLALVEKLDGLDGGGAAVDGEHDVGLELLKAFLEGHGAQAVAVVEAAGEVRSHGPAQLGQHLSKQRRGADAVHVVVAIDQQPLVVFSRLPEPLDGGVHVWNQERVGQQLEPWIQELADFGLAGDAPVDEALGHKWRERQLANELAG